MKNLKKALSVVLASAMLFGMMVVGTGAAHADVTAEHNEEAIAVVSAAGIMGANEEFNPDAKITRNEMAVVMVNMLGLDAEDYAGAAQFTDVPAWAADYVDACYANGIVSGVSATEFNGSANVTAAEAALMMMKALGYFQTSADFGQDWLLATIKQASKIDLLKDIDVKADAQLTRNEVAQLALNALMADVVELNEDATSTTITAGDVQVSISGNNSYEAVANTEFHYYLDAAADSEERATQQLIEKLFEDYTKVDSEDLYGRDAIEWFDDENESIIVVADEADYVLVATEKTTLKQLIKDNKLDKKIETNDESEIMVGQVVELWVNKNKAITDMVSYIWTYGEITDVEEMDEDIDEDYIEAGAKYWVELNDTETFMDLQFENFDAKTYVKGAYVMTALLVTPEIKSVVSSAEYDSLDGIFFIWEDTAIAETFEGKVAGKGTDYVKVDGTKIESTRFQNALTVGEKYTFIKDVNGYVVDAVEVDDSTTTDIADVVYLQHVYRDGGSTNKYGATTYNYYAQVVTLTGEVKEILIGIDGSSDDYGVITTEFEKGLVTAKAYTADKFFVNGVEATKAQAEAAGEGDVVVNYKGTSKLTAWTPDTTKYAVETVALTGDEAYNLTTDTKTASVEGTSFRFGAKANFILVKGVEDELKTEVKAGAQKLALENGSIVIAKKDNGVNVVNYVIVPNGAVSSAVSSDDVIYVDASAERYTTTIVIDDEDVAVDVVEAYDVKGEKVEITVRTGAELADGFFTYEVEDGIFALTATDDFNGTTVKAGDKAGSFLSYYGTEITLSTIADMETKGATWIDLHDVDAADAIYTKSIKTLEALKKAVIDMHDDLVVNMYIDDDAAVVIVITDAPVVEAE